MPDTATSLHLPVLPLTAGVVGPGMVVTIALESPDAAAAAEGAKRAGNRLLLVPRLEGTYATVGTSPPSRTPATSRAAGVARPSS